MKYVIAMACAPLVIFGFICGVSWFALEAGFRQAAKYIDETM